MLPRRHWGHSWLGSASGATLGTPTTFSPPQGTLGTLLRPLWPPDISNPQRSRTVTSRGALHRDSLATNHIHGEPQGFLDGFWLALQEREQVSVGRGHASPSLQPVAAPCATAAAPACPGTSGSHLSLCPMQMPAGCPKSCVPVSHAATGLSSVSRQPRAECCSPTALLGLPTCS